MTDSSVAAADLEALYRRERAAMVSLAALLVGSRAQAEEIVQDAFAAVGERWSTLANPGGYLRTTVVNGCRMTLRRRASERRYAPESRGVDNLPTELVELRDALDSLGERARSAVVLRYFADLPDAEIAVALGCREATVRSIMHRALRALRKELT
jgi:RNA polymerase sigma factor (sigma-70 family)